MNKANELDTTAKIVENILKSDEQARNSDDHLYLKVCEYVNNMCMNLPFKKVIANRKTFGLPAFESVRRSRQKIQSMHPELAGNKDVEAGRVMNEEVFRDYARKRY